jgi:hypothetical protein
MLPPMVPRRLHPRFRLLLLASLLVVALVDPCLASREAAVRASHSHGLYDRPFELSLWAPAPGTIHYTRDGSGVGSKSAKPYEGPVRIETTTVLRAWVQTADGSAPTASTHTFVFPKHVSRQTGEGLPPTWGEKDGKPVPAFYDVREAEVDDPDRAGELERALRSIPTLSLVLAPADLFAAASGIYAHPEEKGREWERRGSIEYIDPEGRGGFQRDCGVRIHGGWARRPEESPKHAFRLLFRERDPAGALDFPLFGGAGATRFTTLVLRAGNNNTFLHPSSEERSRAEYIRDQWMRDTHAAMGYPAARGSFVHLYLNGLYWGLYNLTERPDAAFAAASMGGEKGDYDSRRADKVLAGDKSAWDELLAAAEASVDRQDGYRGVERLLDVPAFIDFMILNLYGANGDWDGSSNWYAARDRRQGGRFQFFVWDGERTLESLDASTLDDDAAGSPARLFQRLRRSAEFRIAFADRVQKHLFRGGALTPAAAARRYRAWSDVLDAAIVGEAARWGSYRRDVHRFRTGPYEQYSREKNFRPEVNRLLQAYFPRRTDVVLRQFRAADLYPSAEAPELRVDAGEAFLTAPQGRTIYFTIDGSDPRLAGGQVAPSAKRYTRPATLSGRNGLKARTCAATSEGSDWSALVEVGEQSFPSAP